MKINRLISITMILLDKERIGAQELADMFEVSPRTGDKCECLEPLHIRTEVKRRIHDIAALYEN